MVNNLKIITTHHWLKHRKQDSFHAFFSVIRGAKPACSDDLRITEIKEMDIPGDRSKLCNKCHRAMYGFPMELVSIKRIVE